VNVLSKIDSVELYGKLEFNLEYFTDVQNLSYLMETLNKYERFSAKYQKLTQGLCNVIEDYQLVAFCPLNIQDKESVNELIKVIDKSNGYIFGANTFGNEYLFTISESQTDWNYNRVMAVQEKYVDVDEPMDNQD